MGFDHRKLLPQNSLSTATKSCYICYDPPEKNSDFRLLCFNSCPTYCKCSLFQVYDLPRSPPPPPRRPPPPLLPSRRGDAAGVSHAKQLVTIATIVISCVIVGMLLCGILTAVIRRYYLRRNNSRRTHPPIIFGTQEDFFDEDQGPVLDHPIWYINTVGLPQSFIDSIAVFKYKKDEGLIEGTECSVCLGEFEEDESLRLLPKCSHAFHVTCIDTWLRSHKNCPLCRAPITSGAVIAQPSELEPTSNALDSGNGNIAVNLENYWGEGSSSVGEIGVSEITNENDNDVELPVEDDHSADDLMKILPHLKFRICDSGCRVLSDLAENRWVVEENTQPRRRSVSLDSSAASMIYNAVANGVMHDQPQGHSNAHLGQSKNSKSKIAGKRRSGSSSSGECKLIKTSSIGSSLQKGPMSMKRSFSSSGRFSISSSRHSRHHSVLP